MALLKRKPAISVIAPPEIVPGTSFVVEATLDAKRPVPVDFVDVSVEGTERASAITGYIPNVGPSVSAEDWRIVGLTARVRGPGELGAGRHTYRARFEIPPHAPPSYIGRSAKVEYVVAVHAAIPWWADAKQRFLLRVVAPPIQLGASPRLVSSAPEGPEGVEPHVEISLADELLVSGGILVGAVALGNVTYNRYAGIRLSVVAFEELRIGSYRGKEEAFRFSSRLDVGRPDEGASFPFRLAMPVLSPSWASRLWALEWHLEVTVERRLSSDVKYWIPLTVVAARGESATSDVARAVPPVIGGARLLASWEKAADALAFRFDPDAGTLTAAFDGASLEIRREHRGKAGLFLVGEIRFPSLGLGLDGGLVSGFRRILGGGLVFGAAQWDKRHYVTGREAAQVEAWGRVVIEDLVAQAVSDLDDEHIRIELRGGGQNPATLVSFGRALRKIAARLPAARKAIPPPACMADAVPSWRDLAGRLSTELESGPMAARGDYDGVPASVTTQWGSDGAPLATEIALHLDEDAAVDGRHTVGWSRGEGEAVFTALPPAARERAKAIVAGASSLTIGARRMELRLEAPILDTGRCLDALEALVALRRALGEGGGPYR